LISRNYDVYISYQFNAILEKKNSLEKQEQNSLQSFRDLEIVSLFQSGFKIVLEEFLNAS